MPDMPGMDHSKMGHDMPGMDMPGMDMSHPMTGALGPYPMTREASGTAWEPDASVHEGPHFVSGSWTVMLHGVLDAVYDHQGGPRGDDKAFASGMLMAMAQRPVGAAGTLQVRGMLSPDPAMGKDGYPLLLASGETADGMAPLVDRQHPYDNFIEPLASLQRTACPRQPVHLRGAARRASLGPPAFMHRMSGIDSPEAEDQPPLAGLHHEFRRRHRRASVHGGQLEASTFNGLLLPRAGPAPLRHRDGRAGFHGGAAVVEPDRQLVSADLLGGR